MAPERWEEHRLLGSSHLGVILLERRALATEIGLLDFSTQNMLRTSREGTL